jgi:NAD-dependent dihydropyrimidine dehydrogenase PreA subunit
MIEILSESRCIRCDICVQVCPTNVFDAVDGEAPQIARRDDCQTCFMCEAYCPVDAMYVSPKADERDAVDEDELARSGLLGGYRAEIGWGKNREPGARRDASFRLHLIARLDERLASPDVAVDSGTTAANRPRSG